MSTQQPGRQAAPVVWSRTRMPGHLPTLALGMKAGRRPWLRQLLAESPSPWAVCMETDEPAALISGARTEKPDLCVACASLFASQKDRRLLVESPVPIVLLLGEDEEADENAFLGAGAAECLPWSALQGTTLGRVLDRAQARRRGTEARLRSTIEFQAMIENAQDIITVLDRDGTIRYESPSLERWLGFRADELVGRNVFEFVHPDDIPDVIRVFEYGVQQPGYATAVELRFLHKDGTWRILESRAKNLLEDEVVQGIIVNSRDITERKRAEEALRKSEARTRALLDAIPDAMVRISQDGTYLDIKLPRGYKAIAEPHRLLGTSAYEVLPPAIAERAMVCVRQAIETGGMQSFEYEIDVEGERRVREARVVLSGDDEVISIQRDITERKRAEEALRKSEAMLRTIVSNIPVILFVLDPDGVFTLVEGKGLEALSMRPGETVGRSVFDFYPQMPRFIRDVKRALAGEAFSTHVAAEGRVFECWFAPLTQLDGGRAGTIGVAADITRIKRNEEALKESREQLRELALHLQSVREEERTRISREVHDVLGQALTALRMDLSWLERGLGEAANTERIDSMKHLIDSTIQTVRRIASDLRPGILDDLGLAAALEWQAQQFEHRTGIACTFTDRTSFLELGRDRSTAIFRIFQEILTNVARHAQASQVDIALSEEGPDLVLNVRDDGRGIREEEVHNKKSLGLLGMRERVVAWGGSVHLAGQPGKGTTVSVVVPVEQATPAVPVTRSRP